MTQDDEQKYQDLHDKLKKANPHFDLMVEYGALLMKHIDSFTPQERARYDELTQILCPTNHN